MLGDLPGVQLEVAEEVVEVGGDGGVEAVALPFEFLGELGDEIRGELGEVGHEVERVLDLVRDPRRQGSERRQAFLRHQLRLRLVELPQGDFQLVVLRLEPERLLHRRPLLDVEELRQGGDLRFGQPRDR